MNKLYKYYFYYLKKEYYDDLPFDTSSKFYSYTPDKELSKKFQLERDMTKFIKEKVYLTKDEVNDLCKYAQGRILVKKTLKTTGDNDVEMTLTNDEYSTINLECKSAGYKLLSGSYHKDFIYAPMDVFKSDISKALKVYKFDNANKIYIFGDDSLISSFMLGNNIKEFKVDELWMFMKVFKITLRSGE